MNDMDGCIVRPTLIIEKERNTLHRTNCYGIIKTYLNSAAILCKILSLFYEMTSL